MIHVGYDGSDHHKIKLHNPLGRVMLIFIYLFIYLLQCCHLHIVHYLPEKAFHSLIRAYYTHPFLSSNS